MNMNEVRRPSRNIRTQSESTNKVTETSNVTQEEAKVEENSVNLETNDNEFFNQVIKSGVEAIKNEQAQRELIYNSLIIGEAISGKIDKVSSTLNIVKNDLPIQQKWRQSTSKNIAELEDKISEIPKEVEGNVMFEIRRIFNNIEEFKQDKKYEDSLNLLCGYLLFDVLRMHENMSEEIEILELIKSRKDYFDSDTFINKTMMAMSPIVFANHLNRKDRR